MAGCSENILKYPPVLPADLYRFREMLLANLVMVGEIPAPTFGEEKRIAFVKQRFKECGLQSSSSDEIGNGMGIIPGTKGAGTILLCGHADTIFDSSRDHTFCVEPDIIRGPGVADNSLGVAVLVTLPTILERLGIRFNNDLLLMAAVQSLEQGNQRGIRYFLKNSSRPVSAAVVVEGCPLGRLHYRSKASFGGIISCSVDHRRTGHGAIEELNSFIHQLRSIAADAKNNITCVLGSVQGGVSYKLPARSARLKFRVQGDCDRDVRRVQRLIEGIVESAGRREGCSASLEVIAKTGAGGLEREHPLVTSAEEVMKRVEITTQNNGYSSTISPFLEHHIPAVCIGLSEGDNLNDQDEYVAIEPILAGTAQLIALLQSIDGGNCA